MDPMDPPPSSKVVVVVPAFNEERTIGTVVRSLCSRAMSIFFCATPICSVERISLMMENSMKIRFWTTSMNSKSELPVSASARPFVGT